MDKSCFEIEGHEVIEREATAHGNGARIIVPKDWRNESVKLVRTTDSEEDPSVLLSPLCVLLLDRLDMMETYNFRELLRYGIRYKHFSDVPETVIATFEDCLDRPKAVDQLIEARNQTDAENVATFYQDLIDTHNNETLIRSTLQERI